MKPKHSKKVLYIIMGTISLILAYFGIVMPGVPGIPFILLTAFFYFRSSEKLSNWVMKQKIFAKVINEYKDKKEFPMRLKVFVVVNLWVTIFFAEWLLVKNIYGHILVIGSGIIVSILIFRLKKIDL